MKKIMITMALVLCIIVSVVSGTLATYTKTLAPIKGEVSTKVFYIGTTQTMFPNIKLAPGEEAIWEFGVVNFKDNSIAEVDMDMDIILTVGSSEEKLAIDGLTVGLFENGKQLGTSIIKQGQLQYSIEKAFLALTQSTRNFEIRILWDNTIASDETDTMNADLRNASQIAVTVTGTQCVHKDGEVEPEPEEQLKTAALRLPDGRYEITFENNGDSMHNGWYAEFVSENSDILSNAQSISVSKGSDTQWNTVQLVKSQNGKWLVMPKSGYQHNAISFLKGEKLILRFSSGSVEQELNISSGMLKVPFDINGISTNFRYDGYNMYIDMDNKSYNSRIYGWELEFKTDIQLRRNASSAWDITQTEFDGQFYTYKIRTKSNSNDGRLFLNPNEKKEVFNDATINHITTWTVKDVKFFSQMLN